MPPDCSSSFTQGATGSPWPLKPCHCLGRNACAWLAPSRVEIDRVLYPRPWSKACVLCAASASTLRNLILRTGTLHPFGFSQQGRLLQGWFSSAQSPGFSFPPEHLMALGSLLLYLSGLLFPLFCCCCRDPAPRQDCGRQGCRASLHSICQRLNTFLHTQGSGLPVLFWFP